MVRFVAAGIAVAALTGCGLLPRKPAPTPPPRLVVCAPEAEHACRRIVYPTPAEFTSGQYDKAAGIVIVLPEGPITADQAAAIAIAERAAWCECATRHTAILNCVSAHNGSGRETPAPCRIEAGTPPRSLE